MYFDLTPTEIRTNFIRQPLPEEVAEMKQNRDELPDAAWERIVSLRADSWAVELAAHPSERTPKPATMQLKCSVMYDWDADRTPKPRPTWIHCGKTPKPAHVELLDEYYSEEEEEVYEEDNGAVAQTESKELVGLGFGF